MFETEANYSGIQLHFRLMKHEDMEQSIEILKNLSLFKTPFKSENLPKFLRGDKMRLTQVLINLIKNSMKFSKRGD